MRFFSLLVFLLLLTVLSPNCKTIKPNNTLKRTVPPDLDNGWVLVPIPNSLDTVGSIFVKRNKQQKYISKINVVTEGGTAQLQSLKIDKSVSAGALLRFLRVKGLDSASLGAGDSTHLGTNFEVTQATYIRHDDDIFEAFNKEEAKKRLINNLNVFGMQDADEVYLVTEIIRSPSVNISVNRAANPRFNINAIVGKIVSVAPSYQVSRIDSTTLKYNLGESLTVFYKLHPITMNIIKGRDVGDKDTVVNVTVTRVPTNKTELIIDKQEQ